MTSSPSRGLRAFNVLVGITTLLVFLQSISAGLLMALPDRALGRMWTSVHSGVAWITLAAAIAVAVVAVMTLRSRRGLLTGAIALVVLMLAQVGLGQSVDAARGLVAVHVPLAFAILAIAVWLSVRGARLRREVAAA